MLNSEATKVLAEIKMIMVQLELVLADIKRLVKALEEKIITDWRNDG